MQPWLLARDTSIGEYFRHLFSFYEGHPVLWYVLVLPLVKLGLPFFSQAVLHLGLAVAAAAVFLWKAPFNRLTKYLWIFSYYMMYEFTVIQRMYGLGTLLIFIIAALHEKRFERPVLYASCIALLYHATALSIVFTSALAAVFILESLWRTRKEGRPFPVAAVLILAASALLLYRQIAFKPADHIHPVAAAFAVDPGRALSALGDSFIPFRRLVSSPAAVVIALCGFGLTIVSLRKRPVPLVILLLSELSLIYLFTFLFAGDMRHYSYFFVFLLFVLWIRKDYPPLPSLELPRVERAIRALRLDNAYRKVIYIINVCLLINIQASWISHRQDYLFPFSGSKTMAGAINVLFDRFGLDEKGFVIAANPHMNTISLLPYMPGRKFWYAYMNDFATYYTGRNYGTGTWGLTQPQVVERTLRRFGSLDQVLFLFRRPLQEQDLFGYRFQPLALAYENVWGRAYETFFLYKPIPIEKNAAGS